MKAFVNFIRWFIGVSFIITFLIQITLNEISIGASLTALIIGLLFIPPISRRLFGK